MEVDGDSVGGVLQRSCEAVRDGLAPASSPSDRDTALRTALAVMSCITSLLQLASGHTAQLRKQLAQRVLVVENVRADCHCAVCDCVWVCVSVYFRYASV